MFMIIIIRIDIQDQFIKRIFIYDIIILLYFPKQIFIYLTLFLKFFKFELQMRNNNDDILLSG